MTKSIQEAHKERLEEIRSKAPPVKLPRCELIAGASMGHRNQGKRNFQLSIQYHGPDAQTYELSMAPAEAVALIFQFQHLLKLLNEPDNKNSEEVEKIKKNLFDLYRLELPAPT